jgi:hypothetical protein
MKVRELIEWLRQYPEDFDVVIASDEEGNDFHPAYELTHGHYDERDGHFSGWVYEDDDDDYNQSSTEREATLDESTTVCIWP